MGEESQKKTADSGFSFQSALSQLFGALGSSAGTSGPFWMRLPRVLNVRAGTQPDSQLLDYEPMHLQVNPVERYPLPMAREAEHRREEERQTDPENLMLTLENFRFLMDQTPAVRTIEFVGMRRDPLENIELIRMVNYAVRFTGADCTIFTDGLHLRRFAEPLLKSRLRTLVVRLVAHRPSAYARFTGLPGAWQVEALQQLQALLEKKQALESPVEIELCLLVDIHNYRDIPELIRFAESLGVDGLRLENFLSPDPLKPSDRSLYTNQATMMRFLKTLETSRETTEKIPVLLPVPLEADMSQYRYCSDPYLTVSVDADFNVSGCSRQLLLHPQPGKIWDADFFNNPMYQWLRSIHHACMPGGSPSMEAVPLPCRACPRNLPKIEPR